VQLAEEFIATDPQNERHVGLYLTGAAHYRAGQYEQAAARLEEACESFPSGSTIDTHSINYTRLFLAMTEWQLGHKDAARQLLNETLPALEEEFRSPSSAWNRRATLELLRDEAKALIEPTEAGQ
jgi:tetratricopeptide (TPR) repeat protein